jgi:putrescine transport system substrate-binding protein
MRSTIARLAATAIVAGLSVTPSIAQERVVNVYNWSDYIDSSILEDFTKETGIKVVYDTFDSNETLETKLLAGGTGYDVVVPTVSFMQRQIAAGVYQKLDKSKLPNLVQHVGRHFTKGVASFDPGNEYSVDYMWGTTGIGYNVDKVKAASAPTRSRTGMHCSIREGGQAQGLRHLHAGFADRRHPFGTGLSRSEPEQH